MSFHLHVRDIILHFSQAILFWALRFHLDGLLFNISLQSLHCNDRYRMIGGCTEGKVASRGEYVKTLSSDVPLQFSWAIASAFTFYLCVVFKQTFKSIAAEPVNHLRMDIPL